MGRTLLSADDVLPLTCTRSGTCCHGKLVWINPWELACLATARAVPTAEFRQRWCVDGGIRLAFAGAAGWKDLPACSQYDPARGCLAHAGRPLACRLYPLGRERQRDEVRYVHDGKRFPCLEGCPEVATLPQLRVADYLAGQATAAAESAQDAYLELVQDLAEGAFVLLLESGLSASGDRQTLPRWRKLGRMPANQRATTIGDAWLDRLICPDLVVDPEDPAGFIAAHASLLREAAQEFAALDRPDSVREAACRMCALGLHLAQSLGVDPVALADIWIDTAKRNGASE